MTINFKFALLQKVHIPAIDQNAIVRKVAYANLGNEYFVAYFVGGKLEDVWLYEDQLSELP